MGRQTQGNRAGHEAVSLNPLAAHVVIGASFRLGILGGSMSPHVTPTASAGGTTWVAHTLHAPERGVRLIERTADRSTEYFFAEDDLRAWALPGREVSREEIAVQPEQVPAVDNEDEDDGPIIPADVA